MKSLEVIFIACCEENPYQRLLRDNLRELGVEAQWAGTRRIFSILVATLSYWKPDIIHLHWQHPFLVSSSRLKAVVKSLTFSLEILILKVLGIKIVWTVHNLKNHENKYQRLELFFTTILARIASAIIAHCETAKVQTQKAFGIKNGDKIAVIPHGNYLNYYKNTSSRREARDRLGLSSMNLTYLHLGRIRPYKGVPELIQVFRQLDDDNTRMLIAGSLHDDQMDALIKNKIKNSSRIKVIPEFIPDDEIQIYMNAADVVVLPYRDILTSGGIILAMSFGKPVIAPAIGCIPEVLDSKGSFLYDPSAENGLLETMQRALYADLVKMGKHNFQLAKQLRWDDIAKRTYEVYRECLKRH